MLIRRLWIMSLSGFLVLAVAGGYYHVAAKKLDAISRLPILPPVPLSTFPMVFDQWQGREVPISETVLKAAGNDDHLSRFYFNSQLALGAAIYIGYTAEPRRMLGHRPDVCYVNSGWIHDYTHPETVQTAKGTLIHCLIHRFYKTGLAYEEVFVLNYYVVNGEMTTDHKTFDSLRWRRPKQKGGRLEYVAQIQISSSSEQATRLLAKETADTMMEYLPLTR